MIRSANITFNFDTESGEVTDVVCNIQGEVTKKTKTVSKSEVKTSLKDERNDIPIVVREETKLLFNPLALEMLGVQWQERILIKLEQGQGNKLIPVIASGESWGNENQGNKLSKTGTIVYKGKNNDVLAEFGDKFTLEQYEDKIFQLVPVGSKPINKQTIEEVAEEAEKTEPIVIVNADDTTEIDEFEFKL